MGNVVPKEMYFWLWREKWVKGSHRIVSKVFEVRMALTCQLCSFLFSWGEKMFLIRLLLCRTKCRKLISLIFRVCYSLIHFICLNCLKCFAHFCHAHKCFFKNEYKYDYSNYSCGNSMLFGMRKVFVCGKQNLIAYFMHCQVLFMFTSFLLLPIFWENPEFLDFVCPSF